MKNFLIITTVLFYFSCRSQESDFNVGQKSITYIDESRNRPLVTEIWYPTKDSLDKNIATNTQRTPFVTINAIPDASIIDEKHPLLLVSHGTGGNRFSLTWFIEKMVKEGYIVVSLDHYGNSSFNKIPREFVKWWERAIDIKHVLTQVLNDDTVGSKIDISKIGGVGFSLGGYTNIALAGGYVNRNLTKTMDIELPPEFPKGEEIIDFYTDSLIIASYNKYKDQVKDERMKAFFIMAPAIGFGFQSEKQTKSITAPIFIIAGKGDTNTPISGNAENYHLLIETSELYLFGEHVNHYVFLNEATEFGKQILPDLTIDHPSIDRREIHQITTKLAINFFRKHL